MTEINKGSQQLIKESNMMLIFKLIHENVSISRADIKKITSLSATTVSSLVEELMKKKLVVECGIKESKTSGRKAVMLKINSEGGYFLGLDVQKNVVCADLYSLDFVLCDSIKVNVSHGDNFALRIMNAISAIAHHKDILGITIGVPGVIDPLTNTLVSSTILPVDDAKDIYSVLKQAIPDVNVFQKNVSGLAALAEKEFGAHKETANLITVDIDDGVGAGVLVNGAIYDGDGMAGEFGHISIDYNGKRCTCGNYGCLELYTSVPAILEKTQTKSVDELAKMLQKGEKTDDIRDVAKALAFGINNVVNLLNPELVIIGGSVKRLGTVFLNAVKSEFSKISLIKNTQIELSTLSGNPVTLGGAKYCFDMMFGM